MYTALILLHIFTGAAGCIVCAGRPSTLPRPALQQPASRNVTAAAFSPNGGSLFLLTSLPPGDGGWDSQVTEWDTATDKFRRTVVPHAGDGVRLVVSRKGDTLVTGGGYHGLKVWDARTGKLKARVESDFCEPEMFDLSADGSRLTYLFSSRVSEHGSRNISVYNLVKNDWETFEDEEERNTPHCFAYSFDNKWIALGTAQYEVPFRPGEENPFVARVEIWDGRSFKVLRRLEVPRAHVWSVAFSEDGTRLAALTESGQILIWNPATGKRLRSFGQEEGTHLYWGCNNLLFSSDGRTLVSSFGMSSEVHVWVATNGKIKRRIQMPGDWSIISSVALSPDGKTIATVGSGDKVALWDVKTGKRKAAIDASRIAHSPRK